MDIVVGFIRLVPFASLVGFGRDLDLTDNSRFLYDQGTGSISIIFLILNLLHGFVLCSLMIFSQVSYFFFYYQSLTPSYQFQQNSCTATKHWFLYTTHTTMTTWVLQGSNVWDPLFQQSHTTGIVGRSRDSTRIG